MRRALPIVIVVLCSCTAPLRAEFRPVLRYSWIEASASVPGTENDDFADTAGFGDFDETVAESAADPNGTASATAGQRSSLRDSLGRVFAQGGTATGSTGVGVAGAQSTFLYHFQVLGPDQPVRIGWAIAQTGAGDVFLTVLDPDLPESPLFAARRAPGVSAGPATAIEDFTLLSGKFYDISIHATHPGDQTGTTSYTFTVTPIPEPAVLGPLLCGTLLLMRRHRRGPRV
jgi:hypothetical protein